MTRSTSRTSSKNFQSIGTLLLCTCTLGSLLAISIHVGYAKAPLAAEPQFHRQQRSASPLLTATVMVSRAVTGTVTPTSSVTPYITPTSGIPTPTPTLIQTTVPTLMRVYLPVISRQEFLTLRNGDFEGETAAWQESSSKSLRLIFNRADLLGVIPHGGEWAAWLGGEIDESSVLSQRVTVPPDRPVLQYWRAIAAPSGCGRDIATVNLKDITVLEQFSLCIPGGQEWTRHTADLSAYAGTVVTLQFHVDTVDTSEPSSLYIDDVAWIP